MADKDKPSRPVEKPTKQQEKPRSLPGQQPGKPISEDYKRRHREEWRDKANQVTDWDRPLPPKK
jgi:hypothetical protein